MIPRISKKAITSRHFSSAAHSEAYPKLVARSWASAPTDGSAIKNFIGGRFVESKAETFYDVHDPVSQTSLSWERTDEQATQRVVSRTPQTTDSELREAFEVSADAFKTWRDTSLFSRQGVMLKYVFKRSRADDPGIKL